MLSFANATEAATPASDLVVMRVMAACTYRYSKRKDEVFKNQKTQLLQIIGIANAQIFALKNTNI